jgi:diguanylate cyclase (GGDEF)-like protein
VTVFVATRLERDSMRRTVASHPVLTCAVIALGLGVGFEFLRAFTNVGGQALYWFATSWVYTAVEWIAVAVCTTRAMRRSADRLAWSLMALALACWSAGDLVWTVWLNYVSNPPFPSLADVFYLMMYPSMYVSLMLLMRSRMRNAGAAHWIDGGVVGLTVAAVAASIVFSDLVATAPGAFVPAAVNLAYPVGDFVLLAFVGVAYSLANWRPGPAWLLIGVGVTTTAVADILYVSQAASGNYVDPALLNALYLLAVSLLAMSAWMPVRRRPADMSEAPQTIILTTIAAGFALALLVAGAFTKITPLAIILAASALILAVVRATLTYMENLRMLRSTAREAVTDTLSGLGNRRRLMSDLDEACRRARRGVSSTLVFFDLNGFKRYNDTFGHAAGDALLARIGTSLNTAVGREGLAYRLGGDEFCALIEGRMSIENQLITTLAGALIERGSGFTIDASLGLAIIPDDAPSPSAVLQLADERMYADKARISRAQTRDVLLALLDERAPTMREDVGVVAALAREVATELGLDSDQLDTVLRAAELHDIGKTAIPDEILNKPGPLDPTEWEFMKQHAAIGERILCAAPQLVPVARVVRAAHERWDGSGYPDGLKGELIPLGARIVSACDAFNAMISDRCYRPKRTREEAIDELLRCAGSQFDPEVVRALCGTLERGFEPTTAAPQPPTAALAPSARAETAGV